MNEIIERIKAIVLRTRQTWEEIESEETPASRLMVHYVLVLAAVPALALFIGQWIIGIHIPFAGVYHFSFGASVLLSVINYIVIVAMIWAVARILMFVAPKFGSLGDEDACFKMAVYSFFPYLAAGVIFIIPSFSVIVYLTALYGLYIMYLGLPIILKTPEEKTIPFMVVIVVAAIMVFVIGNSIFTVIRGLFGPDLPSIQ